MAKYSLMVTFDDGRQMTVEPGAVFTGTDPDNGKDLEYLVFTDHRTTGPILAKKTICYYFKVDTATNTVIYSDNDSDAEYEFVVKTLAEQLDCPTGGLLCLFRLERGGIERVQVTEVY